MTVVGQPGAGPGAPLGPLEQAGTVEDE